MVDELIVAVEAQEEVSVIGSIDDSTSLSYRMHSPHRSADINSLNACLACNNGTNGASARRVIPNHKFLKGHVFFLCQNFQKRSRDEVLSVALVVVDLGYDSSIDADIVVGLMLFSVIGMDCMGHISRNQEGLLHSLLEAISGDDT